MPAKKGSPKAAGSGRKKGTPNKVTRELKTMVLEALDKAGGVDYLAKQANDSPSAFLALIGRVLPLQVSGEGGGPITVQIVRYGDGSPSA